MGDEVGWSAVESARNRRDLRVELEPTRNRRDPGASLSRANVDAFDEDDDASLSEACRLETLVGDDALGSWIVGAERIKSVSNAGAEPAGNDEEYEGKEEYLCRSPICDSRQPIGHRSASLVSERKYLLDTKCASILSSDEREVRPLLSCCSNARNRWGPLVVADRPGSTHGAEAFRRLATTAHEGDSEVANDPSTPARKRRNRQEGAAGRAARGLVRAHRKGPRPGARARGVDRLGAQARALPPRRGRGRASGAPDGRRRGRAQQPCSKAFASPCVALRVWRWGAVTRVGLRRRALVGR